MNDDSVVDEENILETLAQVEETLSVMSSVVGQLREQVQSQTEVLEMSAEEFLSRCENPDGILH